MALDFIRGGLRNLLCKGNLLILGNSLRPKIEHPDKNTKIQHKLSIEGLKDDWKNDDLILVRSKMCCILDSP